MGTPPRKPGKLTRHRSKPDPMAKKLGLWVKELRAERGFTFDAFVEETGLGRGYISELERGLVVPTLHSLAKIAAALEVTVADLLVGDSLREQLFVKTRMLDDAEVAELLRAAAEMAVPGKANPSREPKPSR